MSGRWIAFRAVLVMVAISCTCSCEQRSVDSADEHADRLATTEARQEFQIAWPLQDPDQLPANRSRALLTGTLHGQVTKTPEQRAQLALTLSLTRDQDEDARRYWNESLMYEQIAWMSQVRVWDSQRQWLYPNLGYLFRLHGVDRIDRYGGWDPGKQVDNDYGAVLIRVFDRDGEVEHRATVDQPLVSAAWHAVGVAQQRRTTVVHRIQSDSFTVRTAQTGVAPIRLQVWLVFGDFFGEAPPRRWPREPGMVGGALAFFTVDWDATVSGTPQIQCGRPELMGFDWTAWIGREREDQTAIAVPKLSVTLTDQRAP